ncbi:hypothetical protein ABT373_40120 [Streptomyces sp. NPDC000070]|uniref:hypothetical protein n=1 Tax=Streptomyces sp. NPDC000070 TaxID=3154240 RepID=UPI0033175A19
MRSSTAMVLACTTFGAGIAVAPSAVAGGIGDFLSPAFGTACANHGSPQASGTTTWGTGAAGGNLAGLPVGTSLNQCGGADLPDLTVSEALDASGSHNLVPMLCDLSAGRPGGQDVTKNPGVVGGELDGLSLFEGCTKLVGDPGEKVRDVAKRMGLQGAVLAACQASLEVAPCIKVSSVL